MKHIKQYIFLFLAGACFLTSCIDSNPVNYEYDNVVIVINQGNFAEQNGSISYYHEQTAQLEPNVIKEANNYDLGASIQSVHINVSNDRGSMYVVCNAPDKIEGFDLTTKKTTGKPFTTDLATPRYMLVLEDYILITNWGTGVDNNGWYTYPDSYVLVVNKWNETVVKKIPCGSDAEGILYRNNKLYVATGEGVAVVDLYAMDTTKVIKAPAFQGGAKHLVLDYNDKIWATYPGNGLLRINPEAETAEKEYNIPVDWMGQIAMNYSRNKLYTFETTFDANYTAQESKIYELDLTSESHKEFAKGNYFYAIGVSPFTDNVYTAEVNNFTSNSELLVFDSAGGKLNSTLVGVGTSDFCFFTEIREE